MRSDNEDDLFEDENVLYSSQPQPSGVDRRNQVAFWLLGLFNNFAYVIMLSAAHDLLRPADHNFTQVTSNGQHAAFDQVSMKNATYGTEGRDCNPISTGSILLANIIPAIFIKLLAPFIHLQTTIKVLLTSLLSLASFVLVSQASSDTQTFIGVALASLGSGLGEVTFLAFTHKFDPMVVSSWSSGTGGAGVFGAGTYALLTLTGLSPRMTVLLMMVVPVGMWITYTYVIKVPPAHIQIPEGESVSLIPGEENAPDYLETNLTLAEKLRTIPGLLKYMIPLGLVYFFEYVINQGLFELLYFPKSSFSHSQQYRWYQLDYQVGVLVSRSSLSFIKIPCINLLAFLQFINFILCLFQSIYWVEPSILPAFLFILWEGLLGGAAYVNTFYRISTESEPRKKEFSMGISSLADSTSIGLAGVASLQIHSWICSLPAPY